MFDKNLARQLIKDRSWHHDFEIIPGVRTQGAYDPAGLWHELRLPPDMNGISLADVGALKVVYQATVMCSLKDSSSVTLETHIALAKGLIESLIYILEPAHRREVAAILKRNLRLAKDEDAEASVRVAQLQMPNVEIALNTDSWKTVRRLVARINPKVQEVDLDQVIVSSVAQNLETSGFLPEMRKRIPR